MTPTLVRAMLLLEAGRRFGVAVPLTKRIRQLTQRQPEVIGGVVLAQLYQEVAEQMRIPVHRDAMHRGVVAAHVAAAISRGVGSAYPPIANFPSYDPMGNGVLPFAVVHERLRKDAVEASERRLGKVPVGAEDMYSEWLAWTGMYDAEWEVAKLAAEKRIRQNEELAAQDLAARDARWAVDRERTQALQERAPKKRKVKLAETPTAPPWATRVIEALTAREGSVLDGGVKRYVAPGHFKSWASVVRAVLHKLDAPFSLEEAASKGRIEILASQSGLGSRPGTGLNGDWEAQVIEYVVHSDLGA